MPIPLDQLTLHSDDMKFIGWSDMPTGDPKRGSIPVYTVDENAAQQREMTDLVQRIARRRAYEEMADLVYRLASRRADENRPN